MTINNAFCACTIVGVVHSELDEMNVLYRATMGPLSVRRRIVRIFVRRAHFRLFVAVFF